jgi:acetoin utilization protein AcuB
METTKRMTSKVISVGPHEKLSQVRAFMDSGNFRHVLVVAEGKLIGILSDRDIRSHAGYLECTCANAAMTANPVSVDPTTTVEEAARLMLRLKISAVPVVEHGKPVGILTTSDILRAFLDVQRSDELTQLMRQAVALWTYESNNR